ncbi:MAG: PhzF family phenazine biosynthesis protein [Bacteroidota bacterium]
MEIYHASAFSDAIGIEQKSISGNPAGIVVCGNGLPSKEEMAKMAVEINRPIIAFLNQQEDHAFTIKFYFPDGEDCFLCGHGTLVAAYFINKLYGYDEIALKIDEHDFVINCKVDEQKMVRAYLASYQLDPMPVDKVPVYLELLGIDESDLLDKFYCPVLNDCIMILADCAKLRRLSPDYKKLSAQIKKDHFRAIMITAASQNEEIDYEIRIFCPYVEEDEDISCGSANCYLLPYWKNSLHKEDVKDDLVILCPFKPNSETFGGIEHGNYYKTNNLVSISGRINEI